MEQTDRISYEPRVFVVTPGNRQTITARVTKSDSGLAELTATAPNMQAISVTVDAGFTAKLKTSLPKQIESGDEHAFSLGFVDNHDRPLSLDGPVTLILQSANAKIRSESDPVWGTQMTIDLRRGANSAPMLEVNPESLSIDKGILSVEIRANKEFVLLQDQIEFSILPMWWLPLLMSFIGAVCFAAYRLASSKHKLKARRTVVTAMFAGLLAFLCADWNILGINKDTTSLRGFVLLGFLFAYVGVDVVLRKAAGQLRLERRSGDDRPAQGLGE
jgi:hypothetical protein